MKHIPLKAVTINNSRQRMDVIRPHRLNAQFISSDTKAANSCK